MNNKISIIITAYKESKTIGAIIKSAETDSPHAEIIIIAPDRETLSVAEKFTQKNHRIVLIKDENKGKPAALNMAIAKAQGQILLFTDGDIIPQHHAFKILADKLKPQTVGTGRPIIIGDDKNMLNWWGEILFDIANRIRKESYQLKKHFLISGYLWGINDNNSKKIHFNENLLTEDEFLSYYCAKKKLDFVYAEKAEIGVKYPQSISDWLNQKIRTLGGSYQIKKILNVNTRSFSQEAGQGIKLILKYPTNCKQWIWLFLLLVLRAYAWAKAYLLIVILKKNKGIWKRIETTK